MEISDYGIAAKSEEARTAVLSKAGDGCWYLVICSRGFLVSVNLNRNTSEQVFFPDKYIDFPYASISGIDGSVYTAAGRMLMEFDPVSGMFTFHKILDTSQEVAGFRFATDPSGDVLFCSYPSCELFKFEPKSKRITCLGSMDETEKYPVSIVADDSGYIYIGTGTEKAGITVYDTRTGGKKQIIKESDRIKGCGFVCRGKDGRIYGIQNIQTMYPDDATRPFLIFDKGEIVDTGIGGIIPADYYGSGFNIIHSPFANADEYIKKLYFVDHELVYQNPQSGEETELTIEYDSDGASLSPITAGPDGSIYGSTNHPFAFFSFDPKKQLLKNHGGRLFGSPLGNICAYASCEGLLCGAAYSGGYITILDTTKPIDKANNNPYIAAAYEELHRPRCAATDETRKLVLFGGFGGYGAVGGAICLYDVTNDKTDVIKNEELLQYHSVLCMRITKSGVLVCGTSIETPGGANPKAKEAEIFAYCIDNRKVLWNLVPVKGAREISLMEMDDEGVLHCVTSSSLYFLFDINKKQVLFLKDLSAYGRVVRDGIGKDNSGAIYLILSRGILKIGQGCWDIEIVFIPDEDITAGMAIFDKRIYFGCDRHLKSIKLSKGSFPGLF